MRWIARGSSMRGGHRPGTPLSGRARFHELFVRQRRIGYAPVSSSSREMLVRHIRGAARSNGTQALREAIEAGLVVEDKAGTARGFFASETHGYILFPNVVHGRVVDLQGRAYPTPPRRSAYLNRPGPIRHLYNAGDARQRLVIYTVSSGAETFWTARGLFAYGREARKWRACTSSPWEWRTAT
jgi:hypothetical protein